MLEGMGLGVNKIGGANEGLKPCLNTGVYLGQAAASLFIFASSLYLGSLLRVVSTVYIQPFMLVILAASTVLAK
jgi:hypothetical protein